MRGLLGHSWDFVDQLRNRATQDLFALTVANLPADDPTAFENMDDLEDESRDEHVRVLTRARSAASALESDTIAPIEQRQLSIPSVWSAIDSPHRVLELKLRICQAN